MPEPIPLYAVSGRSEHRAPADVLRDALDACATDGITKCIVILGYAVDDDILLSVEMAGTGRLEPTA